MNFIRPVMNSDVRGQLEIWVREFVDLLTMDFRDDAIELVVGNIMSLFVNPKREWSDMVPILRWIHNIIVCEVELWESNGTQQFCRMTSLAKLLSEIKGNNYHSMEGECLAPGPKHQLGSMCKHGHSFVPGTKNHLYVCQFHEYDSVIVHLVLTGLHNMVWANAKGYDDATMMAAGLVGFFHDMGKPQVINMIDSAKGTFTSFPAHGEIGGMMFQAHFRWGGDLAQYISYDEFMAISSTILRHMCGYYGMEGNETAYKRDLLLLESPRIRTLLAINRVGDHFGKLGEVGRETNFFDQQVKFEEHMMRDMSFGEILREHGYEMKRNKIIVFLIGLSGSGKTYFANLMSQHMDISLVSRDECIGEICVGARERLHGAPYVTMYKIYAAAKELKSSVGTKNFELAKKRFVRAQHGWNAFVGKNEENGDPVEVWDGLGQIPDLHSKVQALYTNKIVEALKDSKKFVVLDAFMNCFPRAQNLPDLSQYFRVHMHIQSFVECTESSVAPDVAAQVKISGKFGLNALLPSDGFKGNDKKCYESVSADRREFGPLVASSFRPHMVLVCSRTPAGNCGYEEALDRLNILGGGMDEMDEMDDEEREEEKKEEEGKGEEEKNEFGVDPKTKNMDVVTFYEWLLVKFNGSRMRVKDWLLKMGTDRSCGFQQTAFIKSDCDKLAQLSKEWFEGGVVSRQYGVEDFEEREGGETLRELYENSIVVIKYLEQKGARFWKNKWAKQMRGIVLFVHPETSKVKVLSYKLSRGAEVLTNMVKKAGLEGQMDEVDCGDLDEEQQDTCGRLIRGEPIDMFLTSKGDGSLMIVSCYMGYALRIVGPVVRVWGSKYANVWMEQSLELTQGKRLIVPSTQGTFLEDGYMAPYMVTALLVGCGIVGRRELEFGEEFGEGEERGVVGAWKKWGMLWLQKLLKFTFPDDITDCFTVSFEAMCADRRGLFGDKVHTELACGYKRDRVIFLGVSFGTLFYVPHMLWSQSVFEEPLWWRVRNGKEVDKMMEDLESVMYGKMTKEEYLRIHVVGGGGGGGGGGGDPIIDYEGWVAMKVDESEEVLGIVKTIYSKVKTRGYYWAHKFREDNLPHLVGLVGTAGEIFPLVNWLATLCPEDVLGKKLVRIGEQVMDMLRGQEILECVRKVHERNVEESTKEGKRAPKDPLEKLEEREFNVRCRILMNVRGLNIGNMLRPIFGGEFEEISRENVADADVGEIGKVEHMCFNLMMKLEPWDEGYGERVMKLNIGSEVVRELIVVCLRSVSDLS